VAADRDLARLTAELATRKLPSWRIHWHASGICSAERRHPNAATCKGAIPRKMR